MTQKFVLSQFDQQFGPFDETELRQKWKLGQLLPIDYVFDESRQDWVLVAERFGWAVAPGTTHPPPLKRVSSVASQTQGKPLEVSGASVMREWKKASAQGAKVKLIDGLGEIDLSPLQPGRVELALQESSAVLLKLQEPLQIHVKPAEPVEVTWTFAGEQTVGQEIEVKLKCLDALGFVCGGFVGQFTLKIHGSGSPQEIPVTMNSGHAAVTLKNTKAENWKVTLIDPTARLRMPETRSLTWQPGPAVRLVLDGPQEYVAGHPLKVQVKAVDSFGNLAKTFQGTVILEIKAG